MITLRPYTDADAPQVAALLALIPELPATSEDTFRAFAALSFNRDARDFRLLHDGRALVGLLTSTLLVDVAPSIRHFRIAIHPRHRRRGLGFRMLNVVRAQTPSAPVLQCNSQRSWAAANAFLDRASFCVTTTELLMRLRAPSIAAVDVPEGFALRRARHSDDPVWQSLHAEAYANHADFHSLSSADLELERTSPGFALTLAECEGEVAGYCHSAVPEGSVGAINSLVVRPMFRGRGLGTALLAAGIAELVRRGVDAITLNVVASKRSAIGIYERLGFSVYDEILTYQRKECL